MPPNDALILDNWFPSTKSVDVRGGSAVQSTGLPSVGRSLLAYNGGSGGGLFAVAGTEIYDVGAAVAAVVSGITLTSDKLGYCNFGGAAGNFLVAVNGQDLPIFYNGAAWTQSGTGYATAITGVTASLFTQVSAWKNRLFFVESGTLKCWYLGIQAIGGKATALDFSGVAKLGGELIATASIASSAGVTPDDYFVAITNQGECLVYRGTNPDVPSAFGLVGNYRIGRPIAPGGGGRFLCKFSADLIAITADGFTTLQSALNIDVVAKRITINDKIVNSVTNAVSAYSANFGWQILLAPMNNKLLINVPTTEDSAAYQFVMNTVTGAWTRFTGWNTTCLEYWGDNIYGIIGDTVYKLDIMQSNDFESSESGGDPIAASVKTSFQYFGGMDAHKSFKMVRPLFFSSGSISPLIGINTDFNDAPITGTVVIADESISRWGSAVWGVDVWASDGANFQNWLSVNGIGYSAALKMQISANNQFCQWHGWEIMFERGGLI
jgi:hypothetical protein